MPVLLAILIIDDDVVLRAGLSDYLSIDDELVVDAAGTLSEAHAALNKREWPVAGFRLGTGQFDKSDHVSPDRISSHLVSKKTLACHGCSSR